VLPFPSFADEVRDAPTPAFVDAVRRSFPIERELDRG
jgi:hypothetical protein